MKKCEFYHGGMTVSKCLDFTNDARYNDSCPYDGDITNCTASERMVKKKHIIIKPKDP
jgi:hypothetical protein